MRWRWILFDADGTLFDFEAAQVAALERTWRQAGMPELPDLLDRYRRINLDLWDRYERGLIDQDEVRLRRFADVLSELDHDIARAEPLADSFVANLSREGRLLDGADRLLEDLRGNFSLALVTNGIAEVQRGRLARSGIEHHFQAVTISGEIGTAKPAGAFFDAAFAACGDPDPAEVVIVGDSLTSDIRGGLDYGIATCWFNPEGRASADLRPDFDVADYSQLRQVLKPARSG